MPGLLQKRPKRSELSATQRSRVGFPINQLSSCPVQPRRQLTASSCLRQPATDATTTLRSRTNPSAAAAAAGRGDHTCDRSFKLSAETISTAA